MAHMVALYAKSFEMICFEKTMDCGDDCVVHRQLVGGDVGKVEGGYFYSVHLWWQFGLVHT